MLLTILLVLAVILMPLLAAFAEASPDNGTVHDSGDEEPEPALP